MAKRRKTIIAGRLVSEIAYTAAHPRDAEHVRQGKSKMSTRARQRQNIKAACKMLELIIAANFGSHDLVLTLTYRDDDLPADRKSAIKLLKKFFASVRAHRKSRGQTLKYLYVTESKHDEGRIHHHVVINGTNTDLEIFKSLWLWGDDLQLETIDTRNYQALAEYLAKEPKDSGTSNGKRMWTPSKGLKKPEIKSDWIDDRVTLEPPPGAIVLEAESARNEFGEFVYLKYMLPEIMPRPCRPNRRRKNNKDSFNSGLEPCIYNDRRAENFGNDHRQEA